ncbi:RIIa domain-containing protein 1 [Spea bombifrons]|uniref:RIIa domain-containing protein 1 n=1 Tax=Spea bombifrons TaxID=233779 RepID=UPI002349E7F4|nr:RIIa domain-containing protein 1 [Spea bombifrons]
MNEPDTGALGPEQQHRLRDWELQTRLRNEGYLRSHREVDLLLSGFLREVLLKRPENIREFAAEHFTNPEVARGVREKMRLSSTAEGPASG